jgi:uncharacterized protein (TIGR00255 family)
MIRSMTGFAHRDIAQEGFRGSLEIKSYNNRYLDLSISLPPYLSKLEPKIRSFLAERIIHGKVETWLRVREFDAPVEANADISAAKAVATVLRQISEACDIEAPLSLREVVGFEGVVGFDRRIDDEDLWKRIFPELEACFEAYDASRLTEGSATLADIKAQIGRVMSGLSLVKEQVPEIDRTIRSQLSAKFKEVLGDAVDEGRVLAEIASALMKYTISEEISRLSAHVDSFMQTLETDPAPGKKLDFLCQEMNREINTIGSKSMLLPVSRAVVELKDALENTREQLRNIE